MNIKLRFALLFTFLVAIILSISMVTIYFLYFNYRKEDFYRRLNQQAVQTYELHYQNKYNDTLVQKITLQSGRQLYEEEDFLFDASLKPIYRFPDTANPAKLPAGIFDEIKRADAHKFMLGEKEGVGQFIHKDNIYVISLAFDRVGLRKVNNLSYILFFVFLGGVIVTGVLSFIFVGQILRPITKLSDEIEKISDKNLAERVTVGRNKDELNQIAKSFNNMLNRLENAFNIQKSFVHHASHELRTPLASMLAQTEAALNQNLSGDECKSVLQSLKEDQQEMIDLTNSLLTLSQFEKLTASSVEWPEVRVDELVYEIIAEFKRVLPDAYVTFEFSQLPESEEELMIKGNDALLKSAFRNLVRNAYQYSDDKRISITMEATEEHIKLNFENKGPQIAPEEKSRLFIPFFRGENAMGKRGFGLGLSIVKRIVHIHIGTIHYEAGPESINRLVIEFHK
jgi:signal transduction histidine kinase